ncbi:hypothetical protein ACHWQZ_G001330 [Mnemiopsis leidyi]
MPNLKFTFYEQLRMKWWSTLSSSIPHSNGYESVENKDKGEFRIELKQCSIFGEERAKPRNGLHNNFFKQLEKGISVDEEVSQYLAHDLKKRNSSVRVNHSRVTASKRCRDVLNFFLLSTFKEGLKYVILCNVVVFISLMIKQRQAACLGIVILLALVTTAILIITHFKVYHKHQVPITVVYACVLCVASLSQFAVRRSYTEPSLYASCATVLVLLYTVLPLPSTATVVIAVSYTMLFELCYLLVPSERDIKTDDMRTVMTRIILQVMSHSLGLYITQQYQAHSECLIYNITKLAMAKEKLRRERKLKERVIYSVMPSSIGSKLVKMEQTQSQFQEVPFRPMVMHYLNNVSILFADIVGFTKMSSSRSAIEIVSMLNTICDHFDRLTTEAGCTKISTLGDCYYCVAGCPDKMKHHAPTIVGLSLKMLSAIEDVNSETNLDVSIRVGIHTGSVLCGVVGIKRFRFDVWSHDVLRANEMESSGLPGKVHISDDTYQLIKDKFVVTDAQAYTRCANLEGIKTYFVIGTQDSLNPKVNSTSRKGKSRSMFKLRFYSSSEGHSSLKSLDEHFSRLKSFSLTSYDMKSPDEKQDTLQSKGSYQNARTSFSEAICTDRKVTDTEVMSQIEHTKSRSAFSARENLSILTLQFHDNKKEALYRQATVLKCNEGNPEGVKTTPGMGFITDVLISLLCISCCGAIILLKLPLSMAWLAGFILAVTLECLVLVSLLIYLQKLRKMCSSNRPSIPWVSRNVISAGLLLLPFVVISLSFLVSNELSCDHVDILMSLYFVAFLHGINFLQILGLMKIVLLMLVVSCLSPVICLTKPFTTCYTLPPLDEGLEYYGYQLWDIPLSLCLFLKLICMVIRTFELRMSSSIDAEQDQQLHRKLRDQAYWLLENLIPSHVLTELKKSGSYHRDHKNVAVCFASVVNFQDFFDAKWKHGHESIRILNELISDIDELLNIDKYSRHIEKIKTALGCTYMAASGLVHEDPDHIFVMMDFLFDIKKVLAQFNRNTMGFEFQMKYGCHIGPVASGVIGQSAPMFDIWGDTVNIASRMMTTGIVGKIQVLEETVDAIESRYSVEKRGKVYVKGKGEIETYFVTNPKL